MNKWQIKSRFEKGEFWVQFWRRWVTENNQWFSRHCRLIKPTMILFSVIPCHNLILFYLILSYLILSYLILSYLILSYLILSYLILSYRTYTPTHTPLITTNYWCNAAKWKKTFPLSFPTQRWEIGSLLREKLRVLGWKREIERVQD